MNDERRGYPSASAFGRYALCPGSFALERKCPQAEAEENVDAVSGTKIHAALAGVPGAADVLSDDERACAVKCSELEKEILNRYADAKAQPARVFIREDRLWSPSTMPKYSGKPDWVAVSGKVGIIGDYKTGRIAVDMAAENMQLRALAVLVHEEYQLAPIIGVIIQPWCSPQVHEVRYEIEDLKRAKAEIVGLLGKLDDPKAPRVSGESQCKYCRGMAHCSEAQAVVHTLALSETDGQPLITPEQMSALLYECVLAERVIEAIREQARAMLRQGNAVAGWVLKDTAPREKITDVATVFSRANKLGATPEQFTDICAVTKVSLKSLLRACTGKRGAELDTIMQSVIAGCTESKPSAPRLERADE